MVVQTVAYAAHSAGEQLKPFKYPTRECAEDDVLVEVDSCGICHSDIHMVDNDWMCSQFPLVPGHEFTGVVAKVGSAVTKWKLGDRVGVGCLSGSCRICTYCKKGDEQYCDKQIQTYSAIDMRGDVTYGGYGSFKIIHEDYLVRIPDGLPLSDSAPLLCAGITTYSPLVFNKMDKGGKKIAVIGLGGLGHMAVQFAAAMGNEVWVVSRSHAKDDMAKKLGAKGCIASTVPEEMKAHAGYFDYLMDTVSADKSMDDYINLLAVEGILTTVGAPPVSVKLAVSPFNLITKRRQLQGSMIGGIRETQEMLDFCDKHKILPVVEKIRQDQINEAYQRVKDSKVHFRFVIDVKNTKPTVA